MTNKKEFIDKLGNKVSIGSGKINNTSRIWESKFFNRE